MIVSTVMISSSHHLGHLTDLHPIKFQHGLGQTVTEFIVRSLINLQSLQPQTMARPLTSKRDSQPTFTLHYNANEQVFTNALSHRMPVLTE